MMVVLSISASLYLVVAGFQLVLIATRIVERRMRQPRQAAMFRQWERDARRCDIQLVERV